jgi:hypothetical protein
MSALIGFDLFFRDGEDGQGGETSPRWKAR